MYYNFKIHKNADGYWAECIELKGCITQADSLEELHVNMKEALNLYLEEPEGSNMIFPMPKQNIKGKNIIKIPVDPKVSFAMYIRMLRIKHGLTQKEIAKMLGMKNIYSYQRLESSKKVNPSLAMLSRIKQVFPEFRVDDILSNNMQVR
jgi:antitoxin HicB